MVKAYATKFAKGKVDKEAGIIYGVSVITEGVVRGHGESIDAISLQQIKSAATEYAGGLKVVDRHTRGTDSVFAAVGTLRNFRIEGKQLLADMHLLKSEENADKLMEMAAEIPDSFGLSIAFSGPEELINGVKYSRCREIYNAALVDVPAANPTGLFSAPTEDIKIALVDANPKQIMDHKEVIAECQKLFSAALADVSARLDKFESAMGAIKPATQDEFAALKKEVTELTAKLDSAKKEFSDEAKRTETVAQVVAKEFAKHTGTSPVVGTDGAVNSNAGANKGDELNAAVQKHYAATKNKSEAIKKAVSENKEFGALLQAGHQIKWA